MSITVLIPSSAVVLEGSFPEKIPPNRFPILSADDDDDDGRIFPLAFDNGDGANGVNDSVPMHSKAKEIVMDREKDFIFKKQGSVSRMVCF